MNKIISERLISATKIVLLIVTITACGAFLYGRLDAQDFMTLAIAIFSYYFGKNDKINGAEHQDTPVHTQDKPQEVIPTVPLG
jgi:hypothetical protein